METPSPERGVFRWAWRRAARRRAQFWVATVIFSAVLSAITAFIVLPPNLTLVQKVLGALTALGAATVAVVASTYILALMAAPYQQRNALRRTVSELQASVSREHAHRLRQLAANLKNSLDSARAPDFGRDGDTWEQAFGEHFPQIRPLLEILAGKPGAFYALHGRLMREAHAAGMCEPPWLLVEFGMPLARMIERHCMVTILPISFSFDWHESGGAMYLGDPADDGLRIFSLTGRAVDAMANEQAFEKFIESVKDRLESTYIWASSEMRQSAAKQAIPLLETAANTDPITTKCFLCPPTRSPAVKDEHNLTCTKGGPPPPASAARPRGSAGSA